MIGFPNVNKDFFGVDKVIDCDGIETRFEFFKKEKFDKKKKDLDETENESRAQEDDPMPAGGKSVIRNDEKPGEEWKSLDDGDEKVTMEAAQKSA